MPITQHHHTESVLVECLIGSQPLTSATLSQSQFYLNYIQPHFYFTVLHGWLAKFSSRSRPIKIKTICDSLIHFPNLGAGHMCLLQIPIGSLCCLQLLGLARIITLGLKTTPIYQRSEPLETRLSIVGKTIHML